MIYAIRAAIPSGIAKIIKISCICSVERVSDPRLLKEVGDLGLSKMSKLMTYLNAIRNKAMIKYYGLMTIGFL